MDTVAIDIDREAALRAYHDYLAHRHYETPVDAEIRRTYHALAKGNTVIKALESVAAAGCDEAGLPKLAIVRADMPRCHLHIDDAGMRMAAREGRARWNQRQGPAGFSWPRSSVAGLATPERGRPDWGSRIYEGIVPIIPIALRPRRALGAYHILWEAEWTRVVPRDPFLLRRLGKGDLWLVVAAWDLTEVERAALQSRVAVN